LESHIVENKTHDVNLATESQKAVYTTHSIVLFLKQNR